ncbi:2-oxo acid dehydrogenase subunit E2 [Weissella diestrammenae]|uniref:Dihydrolipoamide acetyltransferase component of pyruvate dehydrogenase complex n=1 Tax=Weissella diestrammenae TaxID=1162633 RepID=A0A7G9T5P1_9LACO|nr:dihydrolipoamide acetyltransferase family protein [Weissella diestrammenae]MCM0582242.1 2-oxo acid dehydrogenase subunit E2 [Weissella diestrammenae]QNN75416.1 2-oxo acid dehydrogenase subunit E2 [Weissella diestrammenae]
MTEIFKMPDIGEGMAEGDITNWLVKVGDTINVDDPVAEVQNDKLMQEILSPYAGKITKLYVEPNTTVAVGDPLIEFDGDSSESAPLSAPKVAAESASIKTNTAQKEPVKQVVETERAPITANGHVLAMPSVRHFANDHQIDLSQVTPTGRHGHITLADVQNVTHNQDQQVQMSQPVPDAEPINVSTSMAVAPQVAAETNDKHVGREPMTGVRKAIAKAMAQQTTIPAVTNFDQVEVSKLVAHRTSFKEMAKDEGIHLTYLAYAVKALTATAQKYADINATVDTQAGEIEYHDTVNVGIAVSAPQGLYVPVIMHTETKSILTIAKEIETLAQQVRAGTIKPAQMQGATITISNLGSARGNWFTPIINGNEVAILGLGSIVKEPIVNESGELAVGQNIKLSLSYDHRLIDGMLGQTAMNYLKRLLSDPALMLMEV